MVAGAQRRGAVGPDVSEAVYVCLEEAGPMFGHLYGSGSFLASPRGAMVTSGLEVLSSLATERERRAEGGEAGGRMGKPDAFSAQGCRQGHLCLVMGSGGGTWSLNM